jgi:hypothetical protein
VLALDCFVVINSICLFMVFFLLLLRNS